MQPAFFMKKPAAGFVQDAKDQHDFGYDIIN